MTRLEKEQCINELQKRSEQIFRRAEELGGGRAAIECAMWRQLNIMLNPTPTAGQPYMPVPLLLRKDADEIIRLAASLPRFSLYY